MWQLSAFLNRRLQPRERAFLTVATLMVVDDDEYQAAFDFMEGGE